MPRWEKWLRGFLVFYVYLFVSAGSCSSLGAWSDSEVVVWVGVDRYGFKMDCVPALVVVPTSFQQIDSDKHCRCFDNDTRGAESAADLLEALSHSPLLEQLDFRDCSQIPAAAWRQLPDGAWPKLWGARGIPEEELRRLRGHQELEGRAEGDPCRHDPSEGREEEDQRWSGR